MDLEKEAEIDTDWLTVKNYEFKILVMIACLAENHLAYRGKLKDMCDFLGVGVSQGNRNKIKEAINALEASGDIKTLVEGQTWTLTLSVKAERKNKIKKIKNAWISAIKGYEPKDKDNDSVSWENILKVLVYLCADQREVIRYNEISKALGISTTQVQRAVRALLNIDFNDLSVKRKLAWYKANDDTFKVNGNKFEIGYNFN
jgi:hypothetical protein